MISKSLLRMNQVIAAEMKRIGLTVIDVSTFTSDYIGEIAAESVIIGYIPDRAAVFTVHLMAAGSMIFRIDGQVRNDVPFAPVSDHRFGKVERPASAGEIFGKLDFGISIYLPSTLEQEPLQKGMAFFEKFIETYLNFLESKFTEDVILHVAPADSHEFRLFDKLYGATSGAAQTYFENRIKNKLPYRFFPK